MPKIYKATHQPGKICVDKGREFAGNVAVFYCSKGIDIYSIKSETKSALAERHIRSLKPLIFKYMHEIDRNTHIDYLNQVESINSRRVNRNTKLASISVSKKRYIFKNLGRVPYLVSLCHTKDPQKPKFKIGDQVRIGSNIYTFYRSYKIQFTETCSL